MCSCYVTKICIRSSNGVLTNDDTPMIVWKKAVDPVISIAFVVVPTTSSAVVEPK